MKKTLKMIALSAAVLLTASIGIGAIGTTAQSDDPSLKYVKQEAPAEDSSISLWFEPSFKKVYTSDTTPSGKDTYSVYMAKNEVENAQFVLYSDTDKENLTASVTDFTNENGDSVSSELFYEMYVTVEDLDALSVYGSDESTTFIREGEAPDPVAPLDKIGKFTLIGGKSQAFFIKLRTAESTPSGWYQAQLDIKNSDGEIIKTATVYAYVWDFIISEKTALQTSFFIENDKTYQGNYKAFYDYMLDNRMCGMDIPGTLNSSNPYLTMDRVNAVRVSARGCGAASIPYYIDHRSEYGAYPAIYDEFQSSDIWEDVKDKFYFYTADEPYPAEIRDVERPGQMSIDEVNEAANTIKKYWENPQLIVPVHDNHPYPYYHYTADSVLGESAINSFPIYDRKDAMQEMFDSDSMTVWCPMTYAFTPDSMLRDIENYGSPSNPDVRRTLRNLNSTRSGLYTVNGKYVLDYYDWNSIFGEMPDRMKSRVALDENGTHKLWAYCCFASNTYSYCNHLIENTGLQAKMLFWQLYQNDVTGYLYYASNGWDIFDSSNGIFADKTPTGSRTNARWKTNKVTWNNSTIYGDGVLFYGALQGRVRNVDLIGSLRVEIMRDGIEEYQMFKMLEELRGNDAAKAIVAKVSNNVADYLSMPKYTAADKPEGMDDYDYMESVRRELGSAVEAATADTKCEHEWDEGTVTKEEECIVMGEKHFTCKKCGAEKTEIIPTLHSVGDTFTVVSGNAATCTTEGRQIMRCEICGYEKTVNTKAFHDNSAHYVYKEFNDSNHEIYCDVCGEMIEREAHTFNTVYTNTCTEAGEKQSVCRKCGYTKIIDKNIAAKSHSLKKTTVQPTCTEDGYTLSYCTRCDFEERTVIEKTGHNFEKGFCTVCGEADPDYVSTAPEDINGDGYVDSDDAIALLNLTLMPDFDSGTEERDLDFNRDGTVDSDDAVYLLYHILLPNLYPLYKG